MQKGAHKQPVARRSTFAEGLYSGLVAGASPVSDKQESQAGTGQRDAKLQLLVEAPAAVEDALASLLNHIDPEVQVSFEKVTYMLQLPSAVSSSHCLLHYFVRLLTCLFIMLFVRAGW